MRYALRRLPSPKQWVVVFVSVLYSLEATVLLLNIVIDPLWCFGNVNPLNQKAVVIDQRQQKTNRIAFGQRSYDSIIIGSSRTEPIPAVELAGCQAFNYAAPAMYPEEYAAYLQYAKDKSRFPIRRIFIGMDFFGSIKEKPAPIKSPSIYFEKSDAPYYRLNTILSSDTLRAYINRRNDRSYYYLYDRTNYTLIPKDLSGYDRNKLLSDRLNLLATVFYASERYQYNENARAIYQSLKKQFPEASFVIFTTPVTQPLFERLAMEGRFPDYCRWIRELVEVFGGVYNFMTINSVTMNINNYYDADHFFPETGAIVARRISGRPDSLIPEDFGVYVTDKNLEQHLLSVKNRLDELLAHRNR